MDMKDLCNRNPNISDFIFSKIQHYGTEIAQVESETESAIDFRAIIEKSCKLQKVLLSRGQGPGTITALCCRNNIDFCWTFLGLAASGSTILLINPTNTKRELHWLLELVQPNIFLCQDVSEGFLLVLNSYKYIEEIILIRRPDYYPVPPYCQLLDDLLEQTVIKESDITKCANKNPVIDNDVALLLATSGTTGLQKCAMLTHNNIINSLKKHNNFINENDKTVLGLMPFYHAYGLSVMLIALYEGKKLITISKFGLNLFINSIKKFKIMTLYIVPSLVVTLTDDETITTEDMESVKRVLTAAQKIGGSTIQEFSKKFPGIKLYNCFGMTEIFITCCRTVNRMDKTGSIGKIEPSFEFKIVDKTTGEEVSCGEEGVLCLRGKTVMKGYFNNPEATKNAIDKRGWLHSGDIVCADSDGYIFFIEREKEMFKFQGYQIAPSELEDVLMTNEKIQEVAVLGIHHSLYGKVPRAYVVTKPGMSLTEEEVKDIIKKELSPYKQLRGGVCFMNSLPKSPTGKVVKRLISEEKNAKISKLYNV